MYASAYNPQLWIRYALAYNTHIWYKEHMKETATAAVRLFPSTRKMANILSKDKEMSLAEFIDETLRVAYPFYRVPNPKKRK